MLWMPVGWRDQDKGFWQKGFSYLFSICVMFSEKKGWTGLLLSCFFVFFLVSLKLCLIPQCLPGSSFPRSTGSASTTSFPRAWWAGSKGGASVTPAVATSAVAGARITQSASWSPPAPARCRAPTQRRAWSPRPAACARPPHSSLGTPVTTSSTAGLFLMSCGWAHRFLVGKIIFAHPV